ncbi:MAG: hypothetical protein WBO17_05575 [Sphingorhabdus sp.]
MNNRLVIRALSAALILSAIPPLSAQPVPITVNGQAPSKWKEAESDHFKIYSNGDDKYLAKLSSRLEAVHYLLKIATGFKEPADQNIVKVKVYAVADIADVRRLIGDPNSPAAGYYDPQLAGPISVIPRNSGTDGSFSGELILFHEYAHHFMLQYQAVAYPAWYIEGFAELAATASFERQGAITYGKAARHRESELRYTRRYPAAKMVDGRFLEEKPNAENWGYGDAWALTHYLTFSDKRRGQLGAYLNAINAGRSFADAATVFGNLGDLTRELNIYIDGGSFQYKTPPLPADVLKAPVIRPLSMAEAAFIDDKIVMERIAKILTQEEYEQWVKQREAEKQPVKQDFGAYFAEKEKARDEWMQELRTKVARFSGDPTSAIVLAHAACTAMNFPVCEQSAEQALAVQPDNWEAMLRKGQALLGIATSAPDTGRKAAFKDARTWLLNANKANPFAHEPLYYFYRSFAQEGRRAPDSAVDALSQVVATIPQIVGPRLALGHELIVRDRYLEARNTLKPLAYSPHESAAQQQAKKLLELIDEKESPAQKEPVTPTG